MSDSVIGYSFRWLPKPEITPGSRYRYCHLQWNLWICACRRQRTVATAPLGSWKITLNQEICSRRRGLTLLFAATSLSSGWRLVTGDAAVWRCHLNTHKMLISFWLFEYLFVYICMYIIGTLRLIQAYLRHIYEISFKVNNRIGAR